jgi:hypothetical protein
MDCSGVSASLVVMKISIQFVSLKTTAPSYPIPISSMKTEMVSVISVIIVPKFLISIRVTAISMALAMPAIESFVLPTVDLKSVMGSITIVMDL